MDKTEYNRQWKKNHPEKCRKYCKKWRNNNLEKVRKREVEYRLKHREQFRLYQKKYYQKHCEKIRPKQNEYSKQYRQIQRQKLKKLFGFKCIICGKSNIRIQYHEIHGMPHSRNIKYTIDHSEDFVPVCYYCHRGIHYLGLNKFINFQSLNYLLRCLCRECEKKELIENWTEKFKRET